MGCSGLTGSTTGFKPIPDEEGTETREPRNPKEICTDGLQTDPR